MIRSLWSRYILGELFKVFGLLIFSFYFLYVLIDYSSHAKAFHREELSLFQSMGYYLLQLSRRLDLLFPLSLVVSVVKVVTTANSRGELTAMGGGGISLKKLFSPLLWAAAALSIFLYINTQYIAPQSLAKIQLFEERYFHEKERKGESEEKVQKLTLTGGALLVFHAYHPQEKAFVDVFLIKNSDELYRIKKLTLFPIPQGFYVDHLVRHGADGLALEGRYASYFFPDLKFSPHEFTSTAPEALSLTALSKGATFKWKNLTHREAKFSSLFFYKLLAPLSCFLAVLLPLPYVSRFSRSFPFFLAYAAAIIAVLLFFSLLNASLILAQAKLVPPLVLFLPYLLLFLIFGYKYVMNRLN